MLLQAPLNFGGGMGFLSGLEPAFGGYQKSAVAYHFNQARMPRLGVLHLSRVCITSCRGPGSREQLTVDIQLPPTNQRRTVVEDLTITWTLLASRFLELRAEMATSSSQDCFAF